MLPKHPSDTAKKPGKEYLEKVIKQNAVISEDVLFLLPCNVFWKNLTGEFLGCNKIVADIFHLQHPHDIIGRTNYDLFDKELANKASAADNVVFEQGKTVTAEEIGLNAAGEVITYLTTKSPLYDKTGKIIGLLGIAQDITDRKKAEEELIKTKAAKDAVEMLDRAKTEFMQNMSHDMRTALSGIQGFSELLRDDLLDGLEECKKQEYVDNLVASCRALTHIHNQILHAIKIFSGDVPKFKSKFNLAGKLQQIINLHLAKADEKKLQLKLICDKKIPKYFAGDCRRLNAIALELIANALKYTDKGKVIVTATLAKKEDDKFVIKFEVQDTGIGISEEKKEEIFSRFGRLTPAYEGKYIGLGLGLSVVKQFVDDLDGEIYIASKPNAGSTFTCFLPFAKSLSSDDLNVEEELLLPMPGMEIGAVAIRPIIKKTQAKHDKDSAKTTAPLILQVEDEEVCALITQATLAKFGFKVEIASTGEEALQKFKSKHYDLILMDVGLPDISGTEVTRKIRAFEKGGDSHTPIVALTAHVDSANKQQCVESGMDAVLSKPMAGDKFAEILNAFIPGRIEEMQTAATAKKAKHMAAKSKKAKATTNAPKDYLLEVEGPVIDFVYMEEKFTYSIEKTTSLLKTIVTDSFAREFKLIKAAYTEKNWEMLQKLAHKMNGACSSCGLPRLRTISRNLELYLMGYNTKLVPELYDVLIQEYKEVRRAIDAL